MAVNGSTVPFTVFADHLDGVIALQNGRFPQEFISSYQP
jgi:hypothetical protein